MTTERLGEPPGGNELALFKLVVFVVMAIFVISAVVTVGLLAYAAQLDSETSWQHFQGIIAAFAQICAVSAGALVGLLGGKNLSSRR